MDFSSAFARVVAGIGAAAIAVRRLGGVPSQQAVGLRPEIPGARPQGMLPTLKMPTARGWEAGRTPTPASGLKVNAFATGLKHPRWISVLPNGDVTVAEALQQEQPVHSIFDYAMVATMRRAAGIAGRGPTACSRGVPCMRRHRIVASPTIATSCANALDRPIAPSPLRLGRAHASRRRPGSK